jgi:hypothetical protein
MLSARDLLQAVASQEVRNVLQKEALKTRPLNRDAMYRLLLEMFGVDVLNIMSWGDMFMLDMMYFRAGGDFRMNDHGRPVEGTEVNIDGVTHYVTAAGLFTFQAEKETK